MKTSESIRHRRKSWWISILFLSSVSWGQQESGESRHELLFFPSIDTFNNLTDSNSVDHDSFVRPAVDVLYSYSGDRFRFLGEYLLSNEESELERIKVGWQTGRNSMLWLGRYHTPAKFWTTEYHHGQFMQTTITRPGVEEWEDDSGPMPSHITGLSLEHESPRAGEVSTNYGFAVGLGPQFIGDELVPFEPLDPESGHDLSVNLRVAYKPSVLSLSQFGVLTAWNEINVVSESSPDLADLDHIRQFTFGVFGDWQRDQWRLLANFVYFNNELQYTAAPETDQFVAGYVQAEYRVSEDWTVFGRGDIGINVDESPYLRLLPAFISHRYMLGLRWDLASFHSFMIEIADTSAQGDGFSHDDFTEIRFQWSAVFP